MKNIWIRHSEYTGDRQLFLCKRCFKFRKAKWGESSGSDDCWMCFVPDQDPKRHELKDISAPDDVTYP